MSKFDIPNIVYKIDPDSISPIEEGINSIPPTAFDEDPPVFDGDTEEQIKAYEQYRRING